MLCVLVLFMNGGPFSLTSTSNDRFFEKLIHDSFYLFSEFLPEICWEKIAEEIPFEFGFVCGLAWGSNPVFTSNKPTHYLLDYGYFDNYCVLGVHFSRKPKNYYDDKQSERLMLLETCSCQCFFFVSKKKNWNQDHRIWPQQTIYVRICEPFNIISVVLNRQLLA